MPFVDPNGSQTIETTEIRWSYFLGVWSGFRADVALQSGPAAKGGYAYIGSHAGAVHKFLISGSGTPVWTYLTPIGDRVSSTPSIGFGFVYVTTKQPGGLSSSASVLAINDGTGALQYSREFTLAEVGSSSPSLAGNKVFIHMVTDAAPPGKWVIALASDLAGPELYRVAAAWAAFYQYGGNTPAIADGWVFTGGGYSHSLGPQYQVGFLMGWNS